MSNNSIFDIIGPIMVGPSSSHTAGAVRIGLLARRIYDKAPQSLKITLYNSFAKTQKGHGTDKGIIGGVLGFNVDDPKIKLATQIAEEKNIQIEIKLKENPDRHPNSVDIIFDDEFSVKGDSKGAGEVVITSINDSPVSIDGNLPCLVVIDKDQPGMIAHVTGIVHEENLNIATFECNRTGKGETASMVISLDTMPREEIIDKIKTHEDVYFVKVIEGLKK